MRTHTVGSGKLASRRQVEGKVWKGHLGQRAALWSVLPRLNLIQLEFPRNQTIGSDDIGGTIAKSAGGWSGTSLGFHPCSDTGS